MDAVIAVIAVGAFIFSFKNIGWWKWFWLGVAIYLGLFELAAKHFTGKTISQQYWAWADSSPYWWVPASLVALGGIALAVHLVWKRIKKKDDSKG